MTLLMFPTSATEAQAPTVPSLDAEAFVAGTLTDYTADGAPGATWFARHPVRTARLVRELHRLPVLEARPGRSSGGRVLRAVLRRPLGPSRALGHRSVLELPTTIGGYLEGRARHTLRRKIRQAEQLGLGWRVVRDLGERRRLLVAAAVRDRATGGTGDLGELNEHDLWLAAYNRFGTPVLLAVLAVDGPWAVLHHCRTLGDGPEHGLARYLIMKPVVEQLLDRGALFLVDPVPPATLGNGARNFRRMLGFAPRRVRVR